MHTFATQSLLGSPQYPKLIYRNSQTQNPLTLLGYGYWLLIATTVPLQNFLTGNPPLYVTSVVLVFICFSVDLLTFCCSS